MTFYGSWFRFTAAFETKEFPQMKGQDIIYSFMANRKEVLAITAIELETIVDSLLLRHIRLKGSWIYNSSTDRFLNQMFDPFYLVRSEKSHLCRSVSRSTTTFFGVWQIEKKLKVPQLTSFRLSLEIYPWYSRSLCQVWKRVIAE